MEFQEIKHKGITGVMWSITGKFSIHLVTFGVSIILARLLSPADFGLVSMAMVFVYFTQTFMDFGLTSAVIQKKDPTETQLSTVFYISVILGSCLMLLMIIFAPAIGRYYNNPEVGKIARFVSYSFIILALSGLQRALMSKRLEIKTLAVINIVTALVQGTSGVILAFSGFGAWSIVYSNFLGSAAATIILWVKSSWRPKFLFNLLEIKDMFFFGFKMFLAGWLNAIYVKIDEMLIGKIFNAATLGYYFRSKSFNNLIVSYSSEGLSTIFFPVMSHLQDDLEKANRVITKSLEMVCFLVFALTGILYLDAKSLIVILFGAKWLPSVQYFQILAFMAYAYPVSIILVNVLSGMGKAGKFLILEIFKKAVGLSGMCVGFIWGIYGFLWALVITGTIGVVLNMWYVQKTTGLSLKTSIFTVVKYAVPAFICAFIIWFFNLYLSHNLWLVNLPHNLYLWFLLVVNTILFSGLYILFNFAVKTNGFIYIKDIVIKKLWKK